MLFRIAVVCTTIEVIDSNHWLEDLVGSLLYARLRLDSLLHNWLELLDIVIEEVKLF